MANKWNSKVQFPTDSDFINRIISAVFEPSKAGTPMITLELEVVAPESVMIGSEEYIISGVKCKQFYTTESYTGEGDSKEKDEEASLYRHEAIKKLFESIEIPTDNIDWDNLDVKPLVGKLVYTMMSPDIVEMRRNPTPEQIRKNEKGAVLKNPITGKPLIQYFPKVREIFGAAPAAPGATVTY